MPKKTTIFIIILAIITLGLIYLALTTSQPSDEEPQMQQQTVTEEVEETKTATLYFENEEINATPGATLTQNVIVDTGDQTISGAQIILNYNPEEITVQSVSAGEDNILGDGPQDYISLTNTIDNEEGEANFGIGQTPSPQTQNTKSGAGTIATITLSIPSTFEGTTTISILHDDTQPETSSVTTIGNPDSILKNAQSLEIFVQ